MTVKNASEYIKKHYASKILSTKLVGDDSSDYIPVSIAAQVVADLTKKQKEPREKLLHFPVYIATWQAFYAERHHGQKPLVRENPSEKAALWSIMRQVQASYAEKNLEYTADAASNTFAEILKATRTHKFLKDKLSLHLINKMFNELVTNAIRRNTAPAEYTFDHLQQQEK